MGNDTLRGGAGDDALHGEEGGDRLVGDAGDDMLYGQSGEDVLEGGAGDDRLEGDTSLGIGSGYDIADYSNCTTALVLGLGATQKYWLDDGVWKLATGNQGTHIRLLVTG